MHKISIIVLLLAISCLLASFHFPSARCNGKKVAVEKTQFNCTVKFDNQLADFYLDGDLVKQWAVENYETQNPKVKVTVQASKKDPGAYKKLLQIKTGDTLLISSLESSRLAEIIMLNIRDQFLQNTSVKMQIYDKKHKEYVDQVHAKVSKATATHGVTGKQMLLYNAKFDHKEQIVLFLVHYDLKGGFY